MPSRKIIAVDMDEVIADALTEHLARYNREFTADPANPEPPLTRDDLRGRWIWDAVPPARLPALERHITSADFFADLPVMPNAQRVLARLHSRYDIYIATAAMEVPSSFTAKFHWLARHFPFIPAANIVFCGNKSILRADYLIDDNPRQLQLFQQTADFCHPSAQREDLRLDHPTTDLSSRPEARSLRQSGETPVFASSATTTREGILYTSPANLHITGFRRVDTWLDIERMFIDD